jgi:hypothetical protein
MYSFALPKRGAIGTVAINRRKGYRTPKIVQIALEVYRDLRFHLPAMVSARRQLFGVNF